MIGTWFHSWTGSTRTTIPIGVIFSLARTKPTVRLAVAAVSAQHAATSSGESDVPEDARNEAVSTVTAYIHDVIRRVANGNDIGKVLDARAAEWILASMLAALAL